MSDYEQAEAFDLPELKARLKMAKATRASSNDKETKKQSLTFFEGGTFIHDNGKRKWGCAVENILKIIEILGDDYKAYLPSKIGISAGIIENENGRAIIMPIRLPDNA